MRLVIGLVKDRFLQKDSSKERSHGWASGNWNKVSSDKDLTEVGWKVEGD